MQYTEKLEESVYELYDEEYEDDIENKIIDFLNNNNFRSFGDSLKELVRECMPEDKNESEIYYLKEKAKEKGIPLNKGTVKTWFGKEKYDGKKLYGM